MLLIQCLFTDEIFSHKDDRPPYTETHINPTAMMRAYVKKKTTAELVTIPMEENLYKHLLHHHGVERPHIERVKLQPKKHRDAPIIVCVFEDTMQLIVDGSHRYVAKWEMGEREIYGLVFQPKAWREFVVTDFPKDASTAAFENADACNEANKKGA